MYARRDYVIYNTWDHYENLTMFQNRLKIHKSIKSQSGEFIVKSLRFLILFCDIFLRFCMLGIYEYANCRLNAWLHHIFSWSFYKKAVLLLRLLFHFKKVLNSSLTLNYSIAITFYLLWRVAWFLKNKYMNLMQTNGILTLIMYIYI